MNSQSGARVCMEMSMILLDTHALLWALGAPKKLGKRLVQKIESERATFYSPLSVFESNVLFLKGRLAKPPVNVDQMAQQLGILELPYDHAAAAEGMQFQQLLGTDPFDWMLVAQAKSAGFDFYTADMRVLSLGHPLIKDATL